ncbi:MAG: HAD hydrolase family protein, partial [Gemmataceae bacterium]|nr:HAD hydrolase family protein [Gemmataceae bacterium]
MRYYALAADYDGTLAHDGLVGDATWAALKKLKASGRKLLMVTGRDLDELLGIIAGGADLFDRVVAENGAVVYHPETKELRTLADPPPERFIAELRKRMGITDPDVKSAHGPKLLAVGRVIVATWEPHQHTVLGVIQDLGLEMQVIFNKGAVMVLPSGV